MIISEVNSFVDLVSRATSFASELQDGWYKGVSEVDAFQDQVMILSERHAEWSDQLKRHGLSEDKRMLRAIQTALRVLDEQQQYVKRLQKNPLLRLRRKAFPGQLSYTINKVLAIVDAGPLLLAGKVATHDLLEKSGTQNPSPLPFIPDPNYVPIANSILQIQKALEDAKGPRAVTVFGGPGLGKSSVVKYLALHYEEEKKHWLNATSSRTVTFPNGVHYLFCGQEAQGKVKELQLELMESLGFGARAIASPNNSRACKLQEGEFYPQPSIKMKLRSRLVEQKVLIILDDLWDGEVLQQLLVPARGVKYLITSQTREIWPVAEKIQLRKPTLSEARQIMANCTDGLPTKGEFPDSIQSVTDAIITNLDHHPLALANVGISINRRRATDKSHWETIHNNLHVLLEDNDFSGSPVVFDRPYNLTMGASMMLMVESLLPDARQLLFLIVLLEGREFPEPLVRFFYKFLQRVGTTDILLQYNTNLKYLEDRSLVELQMWPGNESTLAAHHLRTHFIRQRKTLDVHSIASRIVASSDQDVKFIQRGDAEATLVTILGAMYYKQPFTAVVENTLDDHLRIINDGVIPRSVNNDMDALQMVTSKRGQIEDLVWLLNVDHGEPAWKHQAHEYAKKIIITLACQGRLDDHSMAQLIRLPQTTSTACAALSTLCLWISPYVMQSDFYDEKKTFSSAHGETMKTLLALLHDNATSTPRRIAVIRALLYVLGFESKDTILSVAERWMELLAVHSDPTLQIAIASILRPFYVGPALMIKVVIRMGEFTRILEVLMGLLVSGKDYKVRLFAGETLSWFWTSNCTSLKLSVIPDALENLFNVYLAKETLPKTPCIAGCTFAGLMILPEVPTVAGIILVGFCAYQRIEQSF